MKVDNKNLIEYLIQKFPEYTKTNTFKSYNEVELKFTYMIVSDLANYVIERLEKYGVTDPVAERLFNFINEQFNNLLSDPEVLNIIMIEIFDNFATTKEMLEFSRKNTSGKARHAVEMCLVSSGVDKPDLTIAPEAEEEIKRIEDFKKEQSQENK